MDNLRAAKFDTIDNRQVVYKFKNDEEKLLKAKLIEIQLKIDKVERDNRKIERTIPDL